MALNIILTCVVIVQSFIFVLVLDLYGRSAALARLATEARKQLHTIKHLLSKVTGAEKEDVAS